MFPLNKLICACAFKNDIGRNTLKTTAKRNLCAIIALRLFSSFLEEMWQYHVFTPLNLIAKVPRQLVKSTRHIADIARRIADIARRVAASARPIADIARPIASDARHIAASPRRVAGVARRIVEVARRREVSASTKQSTAKRQNFIAVALKCIN